VTAAEGLDSDEFDALALQRIDLHRRRSALALAGSGLRASGCEWAQVCCGILQRPHHWCAQNADLARLSSSLRASTRQRCRSDHALGGLSRRAAASRGSV